MDDVIATGKAEEQNEDSLKFDQVQTLDSDSTLYEINPSQILSSPQIDLASHFTLTIDDEEEDDPLSPTTAKPNPSKSSKKSRPKSAAYRVDTTPSVSRDSASSSTPGRSNFSTMVDNLLTSQDRISTSLERRYRLDPISVARW